LSPRNTKETANQARKRKKARINTKIANKNRKLIRPQLKRSYKAKKIVALSTSECNGKEKSRSREGPKRNAKKVK